MFEARHGTCAEVPGNVEARRCDRREIRQQRQGAHWISAFSGQNAGSIIVVIEYPSLSALAQSTEKMRGSPEWQQLVADGEAASLKRVSDSIIVEIAAGHAAQAARRLGRSCEEALSRRAASRLRVTATSRGQDSERATNRQAPLPGSCNVPLLSDPRPPEAQSLPSKYSSSVRLVPNSAAGPLVIRRVPGQSRAQQPVTILDTGAVVEVDARLIGPVDTRTQRTGGPQRNVVLSPEAVVPLGSTVRVVAIPVGLDTAAA